MISTTWIVHTLETQVTETHSLLPVLTPGLLDHTRGSLCARSPYIQTRSPLTTRTLTRSQPFPHRNVVKNEDVHIHIVARLATKKFGPLSCVLDQKVMHGETPGNCLPARLSRICCG